MTRAPSPLAGEGGPTKSGRMRGRSPRAQRSSNCRASPIVYPAPTLILVRTHSIGPLACRQDSKVRRVTNLAIMDDPARLAESVEAPPTETEPLRVRRRSRKNHSHRSRSGAAPSSGRLRRPPSPARGEGGALAADMQRQKTSHPPGAKNRHRREYADDFSGGRYVRRPISPTRDIERRLRYSRRTSPRRPQSQLSPTN